MQDYGTRQTDLAVRRAEWRLSRVYRQAQRDIDEKLKDWQKRHEEREAKYRQQVKDGKITQADFDAWMRGQVFQEKQWQARKAEIDRILLDADRQAQRIVNDGKLGVFASNANYIGYELDKHGKVNTGFTLYDGPTVARLVKSDPQILPKPAPGVQKDKAYTYYNKLMNSAITQGIVQGETIPQIAKRIAQTTGERSYTSAVRNARTAYTGAQNAGRIEGLHQAQSLGIKVKKQWMATLDNRTRDAHADLDGQVQEVDDPFKSEFGDIMYPGDPAADPANTYNCRCTLVYVYPEYPSEMQRRDNETGEIIGDMSYREWEESKSGNKEPKQHVEQIDMDTFEHHATTYIGGGYDIDDVFTDAELEYMRENETVIDKPLYRVEEYVFTAQMLDTEIQEGGTFTFKGSFRSFTRDDDVIKNMLDEDSDEYAYIDVPVIFRTEGDVKQFDISKYAENYAADQQESFVDTNMLFEYVGQEEVKMGGRRQLCYIIRQVKKYG